MARLVPAAITPISLFDIITSFAESVSQKNKRKEFRDKLARYFDGNRTYTFTSFMRGTYACLESLKANNKKRNIVVLPRYSCPSFAHAILSAGLIIKYCDVNPQTLSIDMKSFKRTLSNKVLAVIVSNLFGLSNPIDEIVKLCKKRSIYVLEGADYGIGSEFKSRKVGSFGDFTILNFQEGKAVPIGGGAIVAKDKSIMKKWADKKRPSSGIVSIGTMFMFSIFSKPNMYGFLISLLRSFKVDRKVLSMEDTIRKTSTEFDYKFTNNKNLGSLSKFQASLGLTILKRLNQNQKDRLQNAMAIEKGLEKNSKVKLIKRDSKLNSIHYIRYPILVKRRQKAVDKLFKLGIEASPMYTEHGMSVNKKEFPGAYSVSEELLTLPCHPYVLPRDIETIISTLRRK